jgi:hypothetical protein
MTFETEAVLDRRRLRRRLSFWRVLAVMAAALALGLLLFTSAQRMGLVEQRQIARITIEGIITDDRDLLRLIRWCWRSTALAAPQSAARRCSRRCATLPARSRW